MTIMAVAALPVEVITGLWSGNGVSQRMFITLVLGLWWIIPPCYTQECDYRYTIQPPPELNCNPYATQGQMNRLILTCSVEGPNTPDISIIWFRRTNRGVDELLSSQEGIDITVVESNNAGGAVRFTRHSSRIVLRGIEEATDVGEYWCQVRLKNNGTVFREKSTILTLSNEEQYHSLDRCTGSNEVTQTDCLYVLQIASPGDNASTYSRAVVQPTSSSDLSPTPSNVGIDATEEPEDSRTNLAALYAVIAVVAFFSIIILLLIIAIIARLGYKQKVSNIQDEDINRSEQLEIATCTETSLINQNEPCTFQDNVAYNEVSKVKIILSENISYAPTALSHEPVASLVNQNEEGNVACQRNVAYDDRKIILNNNPSCTAAAPLRPATPPEYEYID